MIPPEASCANHPNAPLTMAPKHAVNVNRWRGLMMSGRFRSALNRVPTTKPSCTDSVSQLAAFGLRCHSFVNAGTTAEPLNHNDIPRSSAIPRRTSVRQREAAGNEDSGGLRKGAIVPQRLRLEPKFMLNSATGQERVPDLTGEEDVVLISSVD